MSAAPPGAALHAKSTMTTIPSFPAPADAPIGVFDSGVGGLSVLRHIRAQLPQEALIYFADTEGAPYGGKSEAAVTGRALAIAALLVERGAKALVVACNTATVAAIKALRARYPAMPVVGVEPGLKPATVLSRNGKIGVLATEGTLAGEKFLLLRAQISASSGAEFLLRGCPGLADQIELGQLGEVDGDATSAMLARFIVPLLQQDIDTLVLGCTHYVFAQGAIERIIGQNTTREIILIDTGEAVARQLARLLDGAGLLRAGGEAPSLLGCTSSAPAAALSDAFSSLLGLRPPVEQVSILSKIQISS